MLLCVLVDDVRCCVLCCFAFRVRSYVARSNIVISDACPSPLQDGMTGLNTASLISQCSQSSTAEIIITASSMHAHHLQDVIGDRPASLVPELSLSAQKSDPSVFPAHAHEVGRLTMHAATSVTSTQPLHQASTGAFVTSARLLRPSSIGMRRAEIRQEFPCLRGNSSATVH